MIHCEFLTKKSRDTQSEYKVMSKQLRKIMSSPNSSILTSIKPFIIMSQITGFTLFTINPITWRAEIKMLNIINGLIEICINVILHAIFWSAYFNFDIQGTKIASTAFPKLIYATVFVYSLTKCWDFGIRHKMVDFVKHFHDIDEKFKELDVHFDYKNEGRKMLNVVIGIVALDVVMFFLAFCIQASFIADVDLSISIYTFFGNTCGFVITFQISTAMTGIRRRFTAINQFIENKINLKISNLKTLAEIHLMTTEAIEKFNFIHAPVIIVCLTKVFAWHCILSFMTLMMPSIMWTKYIMVTLYHNLTHFIMFMTIITVTYYAEWTQKERRKANNLLYRILGRCECALMREQIQNFIWQISDTKVEFSCGLMDFDWKFLFKVGNYV